MNILEFNQKKKLSNDGKVYFVKEQERIYIQPADMSKYKMPPVLHDFKEKIITEVGTQGRSYHLNNLTIEE